MKLLLTTLIAVTFWMQVRHPSLNVHCGALNFATSILWLWG